MNTTSLTTTTPADLDPDGDRYRPGRFPVASTVASVAGFVIADLTGLTHGPFGLTVAACLAVVGVLLITAQAIHIRTHR